MDQIRAGRLRASRVRTADGGWIKRYEISREDLVSWMVHGGIDTGQIRLILRGQGALFLVAPSDGLRREFPQPNVLCLPSLFHLGRKLPLVQAWGAVVDLPAVGTESAVRALREYAGEADRPVLIGLYGEDGGVWTTAACDVFDAMIPRATEPGVLARKVRLLRPGSH